METINKENILAKEVKAKSSTSAIMDGNEAASRIAYKTSDVCTIYLSILPQLKQSLCLTF